jgi:hypothetical protein
MKHYLTALAIAMISLVALAPAFAQEMTVADLKAKGGAPVAGDDLKTLLSGATLRYELTSGNTEMRLKPDGTLDGIARRSIGGGAGNSYNGTWRISEDGRLLCGETSMFGGGQGAGGSTKWCRDFYKLGDKYYSGLGVARNDARPLTEIRISK